MKIAFLHFWTLRMRRGVETMVVSLANELAALGQDVNIVTASQTLQPLVAPSDRVHVKAYPTFRYFSFITIVPFYVFDLMRAQYDMVIVFFADFGEGPALKLAAPFTNPHLILDLTFPLEAAPHRYKAYQYWGLEKKADRILADARFTARQGESVLRRTVEVLPSGTDPHRFRPDEKQRIHIRKELGFADSDIVLLNVGALEERKGIRRVLNALPEVVKVCPSIRYLVLGEGPDGQYLKQRVSELGLERQVQFIGTTADLTPYYNGADIFVMLPDSEAGSIACLEAMSSGLPVIASNCGGFSEVVDESCARLVEIDDQIEIVQALIRLANNKELRSKMGGHGRTRILEQFSWEKIAGQLLALCEEIKTYG